MQTSVENREGSCPTIECVCCACCCCVHIPFLSYYFYVEVGDIKPLDASGKSRRPVFASSSTGTMAHNSGGGWHVIPQGPFYGSAACYAGQGCTYVPLELSNPLKSVTAAELKKDSQNAAGGACYGARVSNVDEFLDPDYACTDGPREGGAIYCWAKTSPFNVACGTGAVLFLQAETDTVTLAGGPVGGGPEIRIEQNSLIGFGLVTDRTVRGWSSDSQDKNLCFVQDDVIACGSGWNYIYVWPDNHKCQNESEDSCDIVCNFSNGFSPIGCCEDDVLCDAKDEFVFTEPETTTTTTTTTNNQDAPKEQQQQPPPSGGSPTNGGSSSSAPKASAAAPGMFVAALFILDLFVSNNLG